MSPRHAVKSGDIRKSSGRYLRLNKSFRSRYKRQALDDKSFREVDRTLRCDVSAPGSPQTFNRDCVTSGEQLSTLAMIETPLQVHLPSNLAHSTSQQDYRWRNAYAIVNFHVLKRRPTDLEEPCPPIDTMNPSRPNPRCHCQKQEEDPQLQPSIRTWSLKCCITLVHRYRTKLAALSRPHSNTLQPSPRTQRPCGSSAALAWLCLIRYKVHRLFSEFEKLQRHAKSFRARLSSTLHHTDTGKILHYDPPGFVLVSCLWTLTTRMADTFSTAP